MKAAEAEFRRAREHTRRTRLTLGCALRVLFVKGKPPEFAPIHSRPTRNLIHEPHCPFLLPSGCLEAGRTRGSGGRREERKTDGRKEGRREVGKGTRNEGSEEGREEGGKEVRMKEGRNDEGRKGRRQEGEKEG